MENPSKQESAPFHFDIRHDFLEIKIKGFRQTKPLEIVIRGEYYQTDKTKVSSLVRGYVVSHTIPSLKTRVPNQQWGEEVSGEKYPKRKMAIKSLVDKLGRYISGSINTESDDMTPEQRLHYLYFNSLFVKEE